MLCIIYLRSRGYQKGFGSTYEQAPLPSMPKNKPVNPKPKKKRDRSKVKSKVTEEQVHWAREQAGKMSHSKIAAALNISKAAATAIITRRNWADLPERKPRHAH